MFRPIQMVIFRYLHEEEFYNIAQLNCVSHEISYYVHHGCMVVKYKFINPVYWWGYVRYCSFSPDAFSRVFCIVPGVKTAEVKLHIGDELNRK
jgi:hypothetical protein